MSDEGVYFDDEGDDGIETGEQQYEEGEFEGQEGEITAEQKYRQAKGMMGFDDDTAIALLYGVYNDETADLGLRGKAIQKAGIICSQRDDIEQIVQAVQLIYACYNYNMIDQAHCVKTITEMHGHVMRSEIAHRYFLETATENIDRSTQIGLFLDLKLMQAELMVKYAEFDQAKAYMAEAEQFCMFPPNEKDTAMCKAVMRILILRIEFAEHEGDNQRMFDDYDQAMSIPEEVLKKVLTVRQRATLMKIEGIKSLTRDHDSKTARSKFYEAFTAFNESGSDKRIHCLPYCALAAMLNREHVSIFMAPEVMNFSHHPVVAPLAQLTEAYLTADVVTFNNRLESARKVFHGVVYDELLDQVRIYVLSEAIKKLCTTYMRVQISWAARKLESPEEEVKRLVFEMILSGELKALVDEEADLIEVKRPLKKSMYIAGVHDWIDGMEKVLSVIEKNTAL